MKSFIKPEKRKGIVIIAAITLIIIIFLIFIGRVSYIEPSYYITSFFLGILACSVYLYGIYPLIGAVIGGIAGAILVKATYYCTPPDFSPGHLLPVKCPDPPPYALDFAIVGWILGLIIAILIKRIKEKKQKII